MNSHIILFTKHKYNKADYTDNFIQYIQPTKKIDEIVKSIYSFYIFIINWFQSNNLFTFFIFIGIISIYLHTGYFNTLNHILRHTNLTCIRYNTRY